MNRNQGLLKNLRTVKKNTGAGFSITSKELPSSKDLKQARSSEQLILNRFLDNKNDKIKNIDQKLDIHQEEIQRNNMIIEELTSTLERLRDQVVQERFKTEVEEKRVKHLIDEMERTNKMLRGKNAKIEDLMKKLEHSEKEVQSTKSAASRLDEVSKANAQLRKQVSHFEELAASRKEMAVDKQKQIEKLREKISDLGGSKAQNQKLKSLIAQKDIQISNLNAYMTNIEDKANRNKTQTEAELKNTTCKLKQFVEKNKILEKDLNESSKRQGVLKQKMMEWQEKCKLLNIQISSKDNLQRILRSQIEEANYKLKQANEMHTNRERNEKHNEGKMSSLKNIIEDLKAKLQVEHSEVEKMKEMSGKVEKLQKKSVNLVQIYKNIVPQIQCPYGHELKDPVTIIPCGHNYCLGCKKGYTKQCMLCNGKLKIEAVYRNELMDDIIGMTTGIRQILDLLK